MTYFDNKHRQTPSGGKRGFIGISMLMVELFFGAHLHHHGVPANVNQDALAAIGIAWAVIGIGAVLYNL